MTRPQGRHLQIVIGLVGALALASCASPGARTTGNAASGTAGVQGEVQIAIDYVGGTAGAAGSGTPIKIGWVNSEEAGPVVFPEATAAAKAAVDFVNTELGGVGGRPLELVTCAVAGTEEQGQACGQRMANDPDVNVVLGGSVLFGSGSLASALAGQKPFVGTIAIAPPDFAATDSYYLFGDGANSYGALATYAGEVLEAKSAAIVYPQIPGSDDAAASVKSDLEKLGITVNSVGYPPTNTDLVGPLTAAGAQRADVLIPLTESSGCIRAYNAIKQLGLTKPVITSGLCTNPDVVAAVGDFPLGWSFALVSNPFDVSDPQVALFQQKVKQYGGADAQIHGSASLGFGSVLTMTKILNELGVDNLTAERIRDAVKAYQGPVYLGPASVDCGFAAPAAPSLCATDSYVITYAGDGKWDDHGRGFRAPAA
jgi:branched-chain amino acid transport system substrate-binding protein